MSRKELRPYQKEGVAMIEKHNGVCLQADEMGLGKTVQVLAWLKTRPDCQPALIVTPANAKYVWEREAKKWLGKTPVVLEGRYNKHTNPHTTDCGSVIINYDVIESWLPFLKRCKFKTLIIDEVHYIGNIESIRYRALLEFVKVPHRIGVSGTPITNKTADLYGVLSIIWPKVFYSPWAYYHRYCRPRKFRGRWVIDGSKNLGELHDRLKKLGTIRRKKRTELKDLPPKVRHVVRVGISRRHEYDYASEDFLGWVRKKYSMTRARRAKRAEAMTKIMYLLRLSARLKMRKIIKWIDKLLSKKEKLIVFSYCTPLLEALEEYYGNITVRIDGSVTGRKRMALVDRFQNDSSCTLALCNGKAAGVALTLTAACNVLGTDLPWSPATLFQAEDRAHRFGQTKEVNIYYLVGRGTLDEYVMETLIKKSAIFEKIFDGGSGDNSKELKRINRDMGSILIKKMLEREARARRRIKR